VSNCSITIDSVSPKVIKENEPFKVTWTVAVDGADDLRNLVVVLLTDDARVQIVDPATHESPPQRAYPVVPGTRLTRTTVAQLQKRKGLVEEGARETGTASMYIHARAQNERDEIVADGAGIEVQMHGLARRASPKIIA
jgi:hypothetical protein